MAEKLFNASVADSTARKYSTASKHVEQLEAELGRKISFPLSPTDSNMILTSLAAKNLSVGTIRSYLAGTKRMATARC